MSKAVYKEKINKYFKTYVNILVILVLIIILIIQFILYLEILFSDLIYDTQLKARNLANFISGYNRLDEEKLKYEMQFLGKDSYKIVKIQLLSLDKKTNRWKEEYVKEEKFNIELSNAEKRIAAIGSSLFQKKQQVWHNGEGFIAEGTALVDAGTRVAVEVDANGFIRQQILAAVILALLMTGIVITMILEYRLVIIRLYKPLDNLISGMKIISRGNMNYRIPVVKLDELGRFIESFNDMVAELKKSREDLEHEISVTKEQREKVFKIYKDVIFAVTQGKLILVRKDELSFCVDEGEKMAEVKIAKNEDVGQARLVTKQLINGFFPQYNKTQKLLICISEAATNIVRHAGSGTMTIRRIAENTIRYVFEDQGPGMDFNDLPSMVFYKGFSTKISLGCGFSIIYNFVDKLFLSTSKYGTTVAFDVKFSNEQYESECAAAALLQD